MVSVSPDPNDEVLDADCWDLPSNDASNIDVAPLLLFSLALLLSGDGSPAVPGPASEGILRRCGSRDCGDGPRVQVAGGRKRRRFDLQSLRPPSLLRRQSRRAQVRASHRSVPTFFSLHVATAILATPRVAWSLRAKPPRSPWSLPPPSSRRISTLPRILAATTTPRPRRRWGIARRARVTRWIRSEW